MCRYFGSALVAACLITFLAGSAVSADWVVSGSETVEGDTIRLKGDLRVEPGGSLTLRRVELVMAGESAGQCEIRVKPGGSLTIEDSSVIHAASGAAPFGFAVEAGSRFTMRDSELRDCGWGPDSEELGDDATVRSGIRGLTVNTDNAVLEGNLIHHNLVGILLTGDNIRVAANTIRSNRVHGIYTRRAYGCHFGDNSIQHSSVSSPFRIVQGGNNTVLGNDVELSLIARGVIEIFASNGNSFRKNTISGLGIAICIYFCSHENVVVNNRLATNESGVLIWGWNNRVQGNTIGSTETGVMTGIFMVHAYNSLVADNAISTIIGEGIWMRDSSNNTLSGNSASSQDLKDPLEATYGILLSNFCRQNVIYDNRTEGFSRGIGIFYDSNGSWIVGNEFRGNDLEPAVIDGSFSNRLYGNNFVGIGKAPYDNGVNQWDHEGLGNYWNDHKGTDADGDGLYPVNPDGVDHFPLSGPLAPGSVPVPKQEDAARPAVGELFSRTVYGSEVIEDQTLHLGNISVEDGGSLILRNVKLITGGKAYDPSDLWAAPGGTLLIEDSEISHMDYGCGMQMGASEGATFEMRNSVLRTCGHEWPYGGLQLFADGTVLENNHLIDSWVLFRDTSDVHIMGNTIEKSRQGISVDNCDGFTIADNVIRRMIGPAVQAVGSKNRFAENKIYDVWESGINVYESDHCTVERNFLAYLKGDRKGAIRVGGDSHRVADNFVSHAGLGICIGEGHVAEGNTIVNCFTGLDIGWDNSQIMGNGVFDCTVGIHLHGALHTLSGNVLRNCATGIQSMGAGNNMIHHNDFLDNRVQAAAGGGNQWDDGSEGNFWSDYKGVDGDLDGIGETPYAIGPDVADKYPLMNPATPPRPEIRANGFGSFVNTAAGNPVGVTIALNPGGLVGRDADWWVGVLATIDEADYWLTLGEGGLWKPGIHPFRQGALHVLPPTEILDLPLPGGTYWFFFVVDKEMDGIPTADWWDAVQVRVD